MELTIKINGQKSYEALLLFQQSFQGKIEVKEADDAIWHDLSAQNLARAYSEDKPEYFLTMIK